MTTQLKLSTCILCLLAAHLRADAVTMRGDTPVVPGTRSELPSCSANDSLRLTYVASLSVGGCPIFVHRLGEVKAGRYMLEPTFCITDEQDLVESQIHHDQLTNTSFFSFPIVLQDENLRSQAEAKLSFLSPKSVSFLKVVGFRVDPKDGSLLNFSKLVWGAEEPVVHLRIACDGAAWTTASCQAVALHLWSGQFEILKNRTLIASLQIDGSCAPIFRSYPVAIAWTPLLPIRALQRHRESPLPPCSSDLQLHRVIQLDNCTAYVHQRRDRAGHFLIEPLLCPGSKFSAHRDYSQGRHYLRLPAVVEDKAIVAAIRTEILSSSAQSIEFMKLWDARIHAHPSLTHWKVEPLMLSTDRKTAELIVYCDNQSFCALLESVLQSEPVNFWQNIKWTAVSVVSNSDSADCELRTEPRYAYRMRDQKEPPQPRAERDRWGQNKLRTKRVQRDGRFFVVVQQRSCASQVSFQQKWDQYVNGFGDEFNFWIGLEAMHSLTSPQGATLRVEMRLWNGTEWFGEYLAFTVGDSATKYQMDYAEMRVDKSNLVFDALAHSRKIPFSAYNADNFGYSSTNYCSQTWGGSAGWWFQNGCSNANPNGVYSSKVPRRSSTSTAFWHFVEGTEALKEFRMMLEL